MDKDRIDNLIKIWQRRNISGVYCSSKQEAVDRILETIPQAASIGISGSVTLNQLDIVRRLEARGTKIFNQYRRGISREESLELRQQGSAADYYLASANAVCETGELVFLSAYGNRSAGISNAKKVIVVCGMNKLTRDVNAGLRRAREYATPLNCQRLDWNTPCVNDNKCRSEICFSPEYKRMCCQILIIEAEVNPDRLKVILAGEELGF